MHAVALLLNRGFCFCRNFFNSLSKMPKSCKDPVQTQTLSQHTEIPFCCHPGKKNDNKCRQGTLLHCWQEFSLIQISVNLQVTESGVEDEPLATAVEDYLDEVIAVGGTIPRTVILVVYNEEIQLSTSKKACTNGSLFLIVSVIGTAPSSSCVVSSPV